MSVPQETMTLKDVKGNHPYADEFPMASEDELQELTDSVATVGLIHPVVLTPDGLVLDGRNRMEACRRAGVEPTFEVREGGDDEYKEFVIGVNTTGRRESMTVQIAAASAALILGHDRRKNGRWDGNKWSGSVRQDEDLHLDSPVKKALAQAGTVLDVLGPPHLRAVRDGEASLNAKYEEARREKERIENAERLKVEAAREEEEREERASEYFANHPAAQEWLDSKPEGAFETARGAFASYREYDRDVRLAEEAREREEEEERQRLKAEDKRVAMRLQSFTEAYSTALEFRTHDRREQVLACLEKPIREEYLTLEKHIKDWSLP